MERHIAVDVTQRELERQKIEDQKSQEETVVVDITNRTLAEKEAEERIAATQSRFDTFKADQRLVNTAKRLLEGQ